MNVATCPLCDTSIPTSRNLTVGNMLFCPRCDCLLQVVSVDPPEVDFPYELSSSADDPKLSRRNRRGSR
jgi:hypothetical protein